MNYLTTVLEIVAHRFLLSSLPSLQGGEGLIQQPSAHVPHHAPTSERSSPVSYSVPEQWPPDHLSVHELHMGLNSPFSVTAYDFTDTALFWHKH